MSTWTPVKRTYDLDLTPVPYERVNTVNKPNAMSLLSQAPLPTAVDLRPKFQSVYDQGQLGSCAAFSSAKGLFEYVLKQQGKWVALSALFAYWNARSAEHDTNQDAGSRIVDVIAGLLHEGCAPESDDPYDIARFTNAPSEQAYEAAKNYKATYATHLWDLEHVKGTLAQGYPAVTGVPVFSGPRGLESRMAATEGRIMMPLPGDQCLGGHAITIAGYDDSRQALMIRNSWGSSWGLGGHFWMPYDFYRAYAQDTWTIR